MIRAIGVASRWGSNVSSAQTASSAARTTGLVVGDRERLEQIDQLRLSPGSSGVRSRPPMIDLSASSGRAAAISARA